MVLVTGGTGLVGTHLLFNLLEKGIPVKALKREHSNLKQVLQTFRYYTSDYKGLFKKIEWISGDVLDFHSILDALVGVKQVYHCAAEVSFDKKRHREIIYNNVEGTANIVNACLEKDIEKLCFVSSIAAIGPGKNGKPIDEEDKIESINGHSAYSISKYKSELEVWRGITEGLPAVIVNPSVILGPGDWSKGSPHFFHSIWKGMLFYTSGVTGYVDVRDMVETMIRLMQSSIDNERFILSSENVSYKELFTLIANAMGKKPPSVFVSRFISYIGWMMFGLKGFVTGKPSMITKQTIKSGQKKSYYSNTKIKECLDYKFRPVLESIEDVCRIYLMEVK